MIVELLEVLCGGLQCAGDFSKSPCFFLACGVFLKFATILALGLGDAAQPKVKSTLFLNSIKYFGCIESVVALIPLLFNLQHNLAYISLVDSAVSILFFWIIFDSFKSHSLRRWDFVFIFLNLSSLIVLLGLFTVSKMNEYATLVNFEQSCYLSFVARELCLLFIMGGLLVTVVHDPYHQLPRGMEDENARESSMLRISLLGMNKNYTPLHTEEEVLGEGERGGGEGEQGDTIVSSHEPRSYYSVLLFSWMTPVFNVAKERPLAMDDAPPLPRERSCSQNSKRFFIELIRQNMKILPAIKRLYLHEYMLTGILILIKSLASFVAPLMLDELVKAASALADSDSDENEDSGRRARQWAIVYLYIFVLFISKVVSALAASHYSFSCQRISISLIAAIKGSL
jgi:hypothetical protein